MKAFPVSQDLLQIAGYIEYILDKKPELSSLHLAAGLVYDNEQGKKSEKNGGSQ